MKNYKHYLVVALLCLCMFSAKAAHVLGGEITWEHVSGDFYKVNVTVYRDCNGLQITGGSLKVTNLLTGDATNVSLSSATSITDVTPVCASSCSRCDDPSCTDTQFGIQKAEFSATVELEKSQGCEWLLSWAACCNNWPSGSNVEWVVNYFESWMDLCATDKPNSSPRFTKDAKLFFYKDQCISYNPGAVDKDIVAGGDILTYRFVPLLENHGVQSAYSPNYSYKYPVDFGGYPNYNATWGSSCNGFHIDSATGEIRFKPTQISNSAMAYVVEEYRKDSTGALRKISSVQRSLNIYIIDCRSTSAPILSTKNNQVDFIFCAGSEGVISLNTSSKNLSDSIFLSWNEAIDSATLTTNGSKQQGGLFKWTPGQSDIRDKPYYFIATAGNKFCPYPLTTDRTFSIKVVGAVTPTGFEIDTLPGLRNFQFTALTTDTTLKYLWNFGDGDTAGTESPVHTFKADDTYLVSLTTFYPEGCAITISDTLIVEQCIKNTKPTLETPTGGNVYFICAGNSFCLPLSATDPDSTRDSVYLSLGSTISNAELTQKNSLGNSVGQLCWIPDSSRVSTEPYKIRIWASDNYYPCFDKAYTDISIYVQPSVTAEFTATKSFTNPLSYFFNPAYLGYSAYRWDFGDGNTSTGIRPTYTYTANGTYKVTLSVDDGTNCKAVWSKVINVKSCNLNNQPRVQAGKYDFTICAGDSLCIEMQGIDNDSMDNVTLSWDNGIPSGIFNSIGEKGAFCWKTNVSDGRTAPYSLTVTAKDSCQALGTDTFYVTVLPEPNSVFTAQLISGREYKFIPADTSLVAYSWDFGDGNTSNDKMPVHTYSADGNYFITLDVQDGSGCWGSYSISQTVFVTSVHEQAGEARWKIYPNPVKNNKLVVEFTGELHDKVSIELFDLSGKQVYGVETRQNKTEIELPAELKPGSYMLRIIGKDNYSTELLLK